MEVAFSLHRIGTVIATYHQLEISPDCGQRNCIRLCNSSLHVNWCLFQQDVWILTLRYSLQMFRNSLKFQLLLNLRRQWLSSGDGGNAWMPTVCTNFKFLQVLRTLLHGPRLLNRGTSMINSLQSVTK